MMPYMTEKFAEYHVTEWRGARVRVEISLPQRNHTVTSQMVIDSIQLDDILGLKMPEDIRLAMGSDKPSSILAFHDWKNVEKTAHMMVDRIAKEISWHLVNEIRKDKNE